MKDIDVIREILIQSRIRFEIEDVSSIEYELQYNRGVPTDAFFLLSIGELEFGCPRTEEFVRHAGNDSYATFYFNKDGMLLNIGVWSNQ